MPSFFSRAHTGGVSGFIASVVVASTFFVVSGCGKPPAPPAGGALPVQVVKATQQDVPVIGEWVAQTDGYVNAQIQPQVSGYLIRQDYKEGSQVSKGQVLFEIDPRPLQATLDQAKGQLAQAKGALGQQEAQLELAKINVQRDTPLAQAHAIAQSTLDTDTKTQQTDEAAVVSAQANIASAQAQVESAELNLGFTKVRSLITGVAGQAQIQVGNLVGTSSVLTSVSQLNPIKVYFAISEQEYLALSQRVKNGHGDLLNAGSTIPLKLTLANGQVYPQTGHIIFVDRSVSAQTGSIRLAAEFANPGNLLRPGQFGRVSAQTQVLQNAVVIPQRAVTELQGMNQVIVVGSDNVAHVRTVQLGTQIKTSAGQSIVVSSGVQPGDTVVTEGLDKVKDGTKVAPQPEPATPPQNLNQSASQPAQNQQGN
jgi:membrane fusion protein (multidrug efflux system)